MCGCPLARAAHDFSRILRHRQRETSKISRILRRHARRPLGHGHILSSSRAKSLPIFLMLGILNGAPGVYHDGWVAPHGPLMPDGSGPEKVFVPRRKYESCAMMQVLRMCVAQEEMWAAPSLESAQAGAGVSNLSVGERRMHALGRSTLLKIERGKGLRLPSLKEEVILDGGRAHVLTLKRKSWVKGRC
jgi:hypothetical protein